MVRRQLLAMQEMKEHELLNYLGFRTALLSSRLLRPGPDKELLCRLADWGELAPARSAKDHCVRLLAKYEPTLSLHALARESTLLRAVDADALLAFLRMQLHGLVRAGHLGGNITQAHKMAALLEHLHWRGPAPSWLRNHTLRKRYVQRY